MAALDKKQIVDIAKPGKTTPDATARPLIITHGTMLKDPMVNDVTKQKAETEVATEDTKQPEPIKVTHNRVVAPPAHDAAEEASTAAATKAEEDSFKSSDPGSKPDDPTETVTESGVIDAVTDQVDIGRKQKVEDKEEIERKEALTKLIAEKKYILPIKQRSDKQHGNQAVAVLILLLLLVLCGGYAAADAGVVKVPFALPVHFFEQKTVVTVESTPVSAPTIKTPTVTPVVTSTTTYTNKDLGVSFDYPKTWGDVVSTKQDSSLKKGHLVKFAFTKQPLLNAGMLSQDYQETGRDGSCYVTLGIFPALKMSDIQSQTTEGDSSFNTATFKLYSHITKTTPDTFIFEKFEAGKGEALPACSGVSLVGYKSFAASSKYTGIQFFWGGDISARKDLPVTELAKYKADPNIYLKDTDRQAVIATTTSAKSL